MIDEIYTPISPIDSEPVDKVDEPEDEWEDVENSDIAYEKGTWSEIEGEELLCGECDEQPETLIQPKCFPEPRAPSQKEIDEHNLTHANYRSWCPHCVAGRRNNSPHKSMESPNLAIYPVYMWIIASFRMNMMRKRRPSLLVCWSLLTRRLLAQSM